MLTSWDHPYESYGNGVCIHCGQIGSYIHTSPKERGELPMTDDKTKTTTETTTPKPVPPPEPETTTETSTTTTTEPDDKDEDA